jgi:hypothetical protein
MFVCSGNGGVYSSSDGVNWEIIPDMNSFHCVKNANGIWVAKSGNSSCKGLLYSNDGISWSQSNIINTYKGDIENANGIWVAVSKGYVYKSADAMTWTQVFDQGASADMDSLHYANGIWVVSSYGRGCYYSTDGIEWTKSNITSGNAYDIKNADGMWVAVGTNGIHYSPTWLPT